MVAELLLKKKVPPGLSSNPSTTLLFPSSLPLADIITDRAVLGWMGLITDLNVTAVTVTQLYLSIRSMVAAGGKNERLEHFGGILKRTASHCTATFLHLFFCFFLFLCMRKQ